MSELQEVEHAAFVTPEAETERVVQTARLWAAAGVLAPGITLGPLLSAGWRPATLPGVASVVFWIGVGVAALGLCLLVWAGCPVIGQQVEKAHRQKIDTVRVGITLNIAGMAIAGFAILVAPA